MAHQQNDSQDYKRIARNTLMLYARFALTLFISLFTSRVVLQALGFNDFGLYNVDYEPNRDFVNGYERNIILDFNVAPIIDFM